MCACQCSAHHLCLPSPDLTRKSSGSSHISVITITPHRRVQRPTYQSMPHIIKMTVETKQQEVQSTVVRVDGGGVGGDRSRDSSSGG